MSEENDNNKNKKSKNDIVMWIIPIFLSFVGGVVIPNLRAETDFTITAAWKWIVNNVVFIANLITDFIYNAFENHDFFIILFGAMLLAIIACFLRLISYDFKNIKKQYPKEIKNIKINLLYFGLFLFISILIIILNNTSSKVAVFFYIIILLLCLRIYYRIKNAKYDKNISPPKIYVGLILDIAIFSFIRIGFLTNGNICSLYGQYFAILMIMLIASCTLLYQMSRLDKEEYVFILYWVTILILIICFIVFYFLNKNIINRI